MQFTTVTHEMFNT